MEQELIDAAAEIFRFKELLKDVVMAAINSPDEFLDKAFPIYQEFVELVEQFQPYNVEEIHAFINHTLIKYNQQPFFPVMAGLFVTALVNKLFRTVDEITLNIEELCFDILEEAGKQSKLYEDSTNSQEINFSLDFIGYLLPDNKKLTIIGPVGDFCGALMGKLSSLELTGMHGHHFGYEREQDSNLVFHKM